MRRSSILLLVLSVVGLLQAGTAAAAPTPGININGASEGLAKVTSDLDRVRALGARTVRLELEWDEIEPDAAGQRDPAVLTNLDGVMQAAGARGIKVLLMVQSTPCWTSTAPAAIREGCKPGYASYPPSDYAAYGRLAAFLADRYRGALAAFEVWNEPDQSNERYWAGPDKAGRYAALVKATYPLLKAADPKLPLLAGTFVGKNGRFLQALYKAGMKGFYDGLSVHFYDLPLLGLRETRKVQLRNGDRTPQWLMETGYNSCAPARRDAQGIPCVSLATQARNLRELFAQTRRTSYLKAVVVYKLRDDGSDRFGVLTTRNTRKPSFAALNRAFARPTSKVRRPALRLRRSGNAVRASGGGPEGDIYLLEVHKRGMLRFRATFRLNDKGTFSLRFPAALGTTGLRVRLVSQWRANAGVVRTI